MSTPAPKPQQQPPKFTGRDLEFLPAALEILETPPAPIRIALMLTLCAFTAAALIWSYFGHLDIHAVAPGKIEISGRAKVIQPLEPGKIAKIHAENGMTVKAGDLLIELDDTELKADAQATTDALDSARAEFIRRRFAATTVKTAQMGDQASGGTLKFDTDESALWDETVPKPFQSRETMVLHADLRQLSDALQNIDKQMASKAASIERVKASLEFETKLMETLQARVQTREDAMKMNVGVKTNLYDAKESLEKAQASLASDQGQIKQFEAELNELDSQKQKTMSTFMADNESKLAEAARKADVAVQAFHKARARLSHMKLFAPIDGVLQQVSITTVGQVVNTGQQLMLVAPNDGPLQVEILVSNLDIGFVRPGQEVAIKVDAFPFTRFGVLHAKVLKIAPDAMDETDAKRALANATAIGANAPAPAAQGQLQSFVFPVLLSLEERSIKIENTQFPLTQGMTVTAEIKTDSRRVIDYLLSPIAKMGSEAMKER